MLRQVYGSFATAIIASVLIKRQDFHYSGLAMTARLDLPGITPLLHQAQQAALAHGQSLAQARETVVLQLARQAQLTAAVQSFDDCFRILMMACLLAILPALFLRRAGVGGVGPVEV